MRLLVIVLLFLCSNANAGTKMLKYVQVSDVSTSEKRGAVISNEPSGLFEWWFIFDEDKQTLTRTYVKTFDGEEGTQDNTEYKILKTEELIDELHGPVKVMIAVGKPGDGNAEMIWVSQNNMFTCRNSGLINMTISGFFVRKE